MSYTVVTTKIDPETKREAQKIAQDLGVPLSVIIKAFLKQFIRTKSVTFSVDDEVPNEYFINAIKKAREERKKGSVSPIFDNPDDAIAWLHK